VEFGCVFLNCKNLFEPGSHSRRGPASQPALDKQIQDLASTLRAVFGGPPELIALSEVSTHALAARVGEAIERGKYQTEWSGPPYQIAGEPETALAVLYDPLVLQRPDAAVLNRPELDYGEPWRLGSGRDKWFPILFQLIHGSRAPFWLVVNHWKSRRGVHWQTENARRESARQIGEFYLRTARRVATEMILLGDFNCEPGERPFHDQRLDEQSPYQFKGVRERALVLREANRLAYFYNPMWRWLGEQAPYEETLLPDSFRPDPAYKSSRPLGTYCVNWEQGIGWSLWDQLMVTKSLLTGTVIRFREASLAMSPPVEGCSDHGAIGARFVY
jgi:hypothetical protein